MRIAILCTGGGRVRRGYEAFATNLHAALDGHIDATLLQGGKPSWRGQRRLLSIPRSFTKNLINEEQAYRIEQDSFALSYLIHERFESYDLLHFSDGRLGNALCALSRWGLVRPVLLFSNGGPVSPENFNSHYLVHQVSQNSLQEAVDAGVNRDRMYYVPYGVSCKTYLSTESQDQRRTGPEGQPPLRLLCLAAHNTQHKRLDYLINEVARLPPGSVSLVVAGQETNETPMLRELMQRSLPGTGNITTVSPHQVPQLLRNCDVLVHPALSEGFGMVLLEGMAAARGIVAHRSPHFVSITGEPRFHIDMSIPGALTGRIRELIAAPASIATLGARAYQIASERYEWTILKDSYIEMYKWALSRRMR